MRGRSAHRELSAHRGVAGGALLSLAAHLAIALALVRLPAAPDLEIPRADYEVDVTPVGHPSGTPDAPRRGDAPRDAEEAEAGGARSAQNIDARDRGQGGDASGAQDAILLMQRDEGIVLFDSPLNNLAAAQSQRIRTARDRASRERRRATPNPHDDAFLASGDGHHRERRPVSATSTASGAARAPVASVEGAVPSVQRAGAIDDDRAADESVDGAEPTLGRRASESGGAEGTRAPSPGVGILAGEGARRSAAAPVAHARPSVDEGPAATQAEARDRRVRDDTDAELLARDMMQRWVESTTRSGPRDGAGEGGVGGGGTAGVGGGRREGGRASSYGPGDGRFAALDTSDARYRRWFLDNRRRVYDALEFPRRRALAMDQGTSIYSVVVQRDGRLAGAPRLVRSSGYEDLDRAALAAIQAATPFSPLPDDIAPELARVPLRLPIQFQNPMFR